MDDYLSSPVSAPNLDVIAAVRSSLARRYPGISVVPAMESGASDALFFRRAGIPTYGTGSILSTDEPSGIHAADERIPVDQFYAGLDHWIHIIQHLAGPSATGN